MRRSQSEKGGDRLQNLISKYRGYSEGGGHQERKIKPLSIPSSKMGLVTKGRSFGPAAPKSDKEVSEEEIECSESRVQESHNLLTSSRTSDAYAKQSSTSFLAKDPLFNGSLSEEKTSVSQAAISPLQENEKLNGTVAKETVEVGAQSEAIGVQHGEQQTEGVPEGSEEDRDVNEEEDDETESETDEDSDNEQKDIDALIDR